MTANKSAENKQQVAVLQKNIADQVLDRINAFQEAGQLKLHPDYHAGNSLKAAWLVLLETKDRTGKPVLESCTKESIAYALQKMIVLGLNPIKKQCDFIAYGETLTCQPEYSANEMLAKRYGMKSIFKKVVYKDDDFEDGVDEKGRTIIVRHKPCSLDKRLAENIIGAYATVEMEDGEVYSDVMTMEMIRKSWEQGATKGNSPAHKNFTDQMCLKTASNRITKGIIRSSDDGALFTEDNEVRNSPESAVSKLESAKANASITAETISFEEAETQQEPVNDANALTEQEKAEILKEEAEQQDLFAKK